MADTLLPPNAQPYLKALSEAFSAVGDLPIGVLEDLWDPARAPEAVLPLLAQALGVTLWRGDWSLLKKRQVLAQAPALARHRGTRAAFEQLLALVDAELVDFRAPPQTLLARRPRTAQERAAWAAQFPELRIRQVRVRHRRRGGLVVGECWLGGRRAARSSSAPEFSGPRATVVTQGAETIVPLRPVAEGGHQVALSSRAQRFVPGRSLGKSAGAPRASTAADRLYNFTAGTVRMDALAPSATSTDVLLAPVHRADRRVGGMRVGQALAGGSAPRVSTAGERVYQSVRLFDPAQARAGRVASRGGWYAGRGRLGQPAFQLRLDIDLARKTPGRRAWPFSPTGPLRAHDSRPMDDAMAAARAAKLGRDQVLLRTGLYRPIRAGDGVSLDGGHRLGQIVRSL